MRALITGCAGFLGSHLAELLLSKGYEVHGLLQRHDQLRHLEGIRSGIQLLECDIRQEHAVAQVINQARPEELYHLASISSLPYSLEQPRLTYETNISGTLHVLEAARQLSPPPRVLYVSTAQVYKESLRGEPLYEDAPTDPQSPYAVSKACGELLARQYHSCFGLPVVLTRPFNSIGPRQSPDFSTSGLARQVAEISLGRREPIICAGEMSRERDFTDARDVVRAFRLLLHKGQAGEVYNICTGRAHSLREVFEVLTGLAGVEVKIRLDSSRLRRSDPARIVGDASKLRRETGWEPAFPLAQSLSDLLEYWKCPAAAPAEVKS